MLTKILKFLLNLIQHMFKICNFLSQILSIIVGIKLVSGNLNYQLVVINYIALKLMFLLNAFPPLFYFTFTHQPSKYSAKE